MAVPRNRHSNARKKNKRAHHAKSPRLFVSCTNCNVKKPSHVICPECGFYSGRNVYEEQAVEAS